VDTLGWRRQDVRGSIEEVQAHEEYGLVLCDGDRRSEDVILVGTRQDQSMACKAGHVYRAAHHLQDNLQVWAEPTGPLSKPRKKLKYVRWERDKANDLWQTDWKWFGKRIIAFLDSHILADVLT